MNMTKTLFRDDPYLKSCEARVTGLDDRGGVILDRTIFYPGGGGQPGDTGRIITQGGDSISIADTVTDRASGEILHIPEAGAPAPAPAPGESVRLELDWERRYAHMRMHTCLHLLSAVLPYPVTGGQVGAETSRLDFALPDPPGKEAISQKLNQLIEQDFDVSARWISADELNGNPSLVKTMSVKPPEGAADVRLVQIADCDLQACGGTHVKRTGEIGAVAVKKIVNKGRQNRRVVIAFA